MFKTRFIVLALAGVVWLNLCDARSVAKPALFLMSVQKIDNLPREDRQKGLFCDDYYFQCLDEERSYLGEICVVFRPRGFSCEHDFGDIEGVVQACRREKDPGTHSVRKTGKKCG